MAATLELVRDFDELCKRSPWAAENGDLVEKLRNALLRGEVNVRGFHLRALR